MMMYRGNLFLLCMCLLTVVGCEDRESRWEAAEEASEQTPVAVSEAALPGSSFNKFFPEEGGEIDLVFKQEKDGFAQAELHRDGDAIAMLSISDTRNNPAAREKYQTSTDTIDAYPAVAMENSTSLLVADRFQVQVRSESGSLTAEDRAKWLKKFDLAGLSNAF